MGRKLIDLTGEQFGKLTVIERDTTSPPKYIKWKCQCECGNITYATGINLRTGNTKSCGCLLTEFNDLSGRQYGDLTVLRRDTSRPKIYYICRCKCGNITSVRSDGLLNGHVHSCGCSTESNGVRAIKQLLIDNDIEFETEVCFDDLVSPRGGRLRYDFGIKENGRICRLIEFDGRQHDHAIDGWWGGSEGLDYRKQCDIMKNEYAHQHNLPLVRISHKEESNISLSILFGKNKELLSA